MDELPEGLELELLGLELLVEGLELEDEGLELLVEGLELEDEGLELEPLGLELPAANISVAHTKTADIRIVVSNFFIIFSPILAIYYSTVPRRCKAYMQKDKFLPLSRPNPLIQSQEKWNKDQIVVYNMNWKSITFNSDVEFDKEEINLLEEIKEEVKKAEEPVKTDNFLENNVVIFHCLPANIKKYSDSLYGDSYKKIEYGEKIKLEGIVVKQDEYFFSFWTNLDKLEVESIIFPSMYRNGAKYNVFKWWKVKNTEVKGNGIIVSCIISDYQPHFADD